MQYLNTTHVIDNFRNQSNLLAFITWNISWQITLLEDVIIPQSSWAVLFVHDAI